MNVALHQARMTREQFLDWADLQNERHEFDGYGPVAMRGGTGNHSQISQNLYFALRSRLQGSGWRVLGPDAGLATGDEAVRYPDALVTRAQFAGASRTIPGVVVVFEVLSPSSGHRDRIEKIREYQRIKTLRRYIIVEYDNLGLTVLSRMDGQADWTATALLADDTLELPELGIEFPVPELYADVDLPADEEVPDANA